MTINLSDNNPRVNYTATSGQTAFTIPFDYFDDGDISVYQNGTLKTITTHYTISGSTMTLVTGATTGDKIAITRDVPLERTTDLTSTYSASSINSQLDTIVAQIADLDDRVSRSISLNDYEIAVSLDLPATADRLGKTIQFNSSTGALEVGPSGDELTSIASIASEITALDGISANITTVAGAISNVNSVGSNISSVTSVAGSISNINTVNTNIANVNLVGASIADVNDVADSIDQVELVAGSISNVDTVALANTNIGTVAGDISNINTVAGISANITTVAGITAAISTVNSNAADITTVSNNIDDVNDVANVITKVTTVADNIANVNTLSSQAANIGTLAGISGSINSLGGISSDITTLAAVASDIGDAATNAAAAESAKTAAESARDATLAAYDSFDDRYLGAKSTEPTLDNDGNPLVSGSLYFDNNTDTMKLYTGSAWVAAYVTGTGVLATSGGTMTGNLNFGDNVKSVYGAGSDLQIYSDGDHSYISETGITGSLYIDGTNLRLRSTAGDVYLKAIADGAVDLYYDNSPKLTTTSTGVDITGTLTSDGLTVEDADGATIRIQSSDTSVDGGSLGQLEFYSNDASTGGTGVKGKIQVTDTSSFGTAYEMNFFTGYVTGGAHAETKKMSIGPFGDISFYEDTGTTAKFFWDASAESLGIGTSSPDNPLHVVYADSTAYSDATGDFGVQIENTDTTTNSFSQLHFRTGNSDSYIRSIREGDNLSSLAFLTDDGGTTGDVGEVMRLTSGGNVGIGTSSPSELLSLEGVVGPNADSPYLALSAGRPTDRYSAIGLNRGSTSNQVGLSFYTTNNLDTPTEKMRIDSSGNVGIGTSSPNQNLQVKSGSGGGLTLQANTATQNEYSQLGFVPSTNDAANPNAYIRGLRGATSTATFLTFGTTNLERMRIDSNGNVGIKTTSPAGDLHVYDASADCNLVIQSGGGNSQVGFGDNANNFTGKITYNHTSDYMMFQVNQAERMRIDSSGNVGIGTSSPSAPLHVAGDARIGAGTGDASLMGMVASGDNFKITTSSSIGTVSFDRNVGIGTASPASALHVSGGADNLVARFVSSDTLSYVSFLDSGTTSDTSVAIGASGNNFTVYTGSSFGSERMRIDSSGNLLVGTTSTDYNSYTGVRVSQLGNLRATASNDGALLLNRLSSDGDIATFRKDSTTVGSIASRSGVVTSIILDPRSGGTGLTGGYQGVFPTSNTGAINDAHADLGGSSNRFRNLYLSGGVYLGGTGSANKLDDYEEGTWTPTFSSSSFATGITVNNAHYAKIGDLVNVTAAVVFTGTTGNYAVGDNYQLGGLPFSMSDTHGRNGSGWASASSNRIGFNNLAQLNYIAGNVTSVYGTLARTYAVTITITYKISAT